MISAANPVQTSKSQSSSAPLADSSTSYNEKVRRAAQDKEPAILANIYEEDVNIAIWRRELSSPLQNSVNAFLASRPGIQVSMSVTPQRALASIQESLGNDSPPELNEDIARLVDMFCCLFELKRTGLRLTALDQAMCPRFHVDNVPCRMVTTYQGVATEWLPHQQVDRNKLGAGNLGLADNRSGLFHSEMDIQQLCGGHVALLKGELWEGNENAGLVHRSPSVPRGKNRLLLTLDFSD